MTTPDPDRPFTEAEIRAKAREMFGDSVAPIEASSGYRSMAVGLAQFYTATLETNAFTMEQAIELVHDLLHIVVNDALEQQRKKKGN